LKDPLRGPSDQIFFIIEDQKGGKAAAIPYNMGTGFKAAYQPQGDCFGRGWTQGILMLSGALPRNDVREQFKVSSRGYANKE
jgi:hypothetical protein